jgi:hypothetical protein
MERMFELPREFGCHRVHALGAVQRDMSDSVGNRALDNAHMQSHQLFRRFLI